MTEIRQGEVCLSDAITFQRGTVTAEKGFKIMSILVGMVPDGQDPRPEEAMREIGWVNSNMYEVRAHGENAQMQVVFCSNSMKEAVEDGVRCVRKHFGCDPKVIEFSLIQIGRVDENGDLLSKKSKTFFGWGNESGVDLDQMIADL